MEYIWSVFAVTQAVIVTFQVGSKLLFQHSPPPGLMHANSSNTTDSSILVSPCDPELDKSGIEIEAHSVAGVIAESVARSKQTQDDLVVAFRRAIQLGLQQQSLIATQKPSMILDTTRIPYVVVKNRNSESLRSVEPYRMSLVPVLPQDRVAEIESEVVEDTHAHGINQMANGTQIQSVDGMSQNNSDVLNVPDDDDLDEYWETEYIVRNKSQMDTEVTQIVARIRVYAPKTFQRLRSHFGIRDEGYRESLLSTGPYTFMGSNSKGSQRTGGIFFYTSPSVVPPAHKKRKPDTAASRILPMPFFVKTIKDDEFLTVRSHILPRYEQYMKQYGRLSLLNRIYGLFEIELYEQTSAFSQNNLSDGDVSDTSGLDKIRKELKHRYYLLVLNAVFDPSASDIHEIYDLKGSVLGRQTKIRGDVKLQGVICKDLDLILEDKEAQEGLRVESNESDVNVVQEDVLDPISPSLHSKLYVGSEAKVRLFQQLQLDVDFLSSCSVMDYSLLVGIQSHNTNDAVLSNQRNHFFRGWWSSARKNANDKVFSDDASPFSKILGRRRGLPVTYHFGIIDFLQPYNYKKELEYRWKGLLYRKHSYSCIPPDLYAQRLMNFLDKYIA
jgi:Phosphatidylinositol-4-phosphate 5-Kinase